MFLMGLYIYVWKHKRCNGRLVRDGFLRRCSPKQCVFLKCWYIVLLKSCAFCWSRTQQHCENNTSRSNSQHDLYHQLGPPFHAQVGTLVLGWYVGTRLVYQSPPHSYRLMPGCLNKLPQILLGGYGKEVDKKHIDMCYALACTHIESVFHAQT